MAEVSRSGGLHDFQMASRKTEEAALRRYQAVHWLECLVGPLGIPSQPSEREFISCLRNGLILCNVINKIQPGSISKVVENHCPVQSESIIWDSQPLPAYQYFENVRNFLVAVKELNLPVFEASDLERENVEAGSAARIADCILALKSYNEWKEWSGGNGVYKHVTVKSPLVHHSSGKNFSRPLSTIAAQPCRRLDLSAVDDKHSITDSIVKAFADHMVEVKENIGDNFLASFQNGNQDPVQIFSEILSRCLEKKLRNKIPSVISREPSSQAQSATILKDNSSIQYSLERCRAQSRKGSSDHWHVLRSRESDLSEIKALWSQTKREFQELQSQMFSDLKYLGRLVDDMSTPALGYQKVVQENRKLYDMVQDLRGNIRVYCKIRPILGAEAKTLTNLVGEDGSLAIFDPSKPKNDGRKVFQFNRVYGPMATQDELFKDTQPLIRCVMDGSSVCILAYGQSRSGKTHTMYGPLGASAEEMGINFLALDDLFQLANQRKDHTNYDVYLQMVEICDEQIRDLLAENSVPYDEPSLPDVTSHFVKSNVDATNLVKHAKINSQGTHSHSVVTVHVHGKDTYGNILHGRLHLVDLAGSEVDNSEDSRSLSCLEDVIESLSQKSSHIPYENSKLTSYLQDALGGHGKILMFAHVNPEADNFRETISTLKFAERVSTAEHGAAHLNKKNTEAMELKQEIEILKSALMEKDTRSARTIRQLLSPSEKARVTTERTPPRSRRLSLENSGIRKSEKPITVTAEPTQKVRRLSIENGSIKKTQKVQDLGAVKPIESPMIIRSEKTHKLKESKSPYEGRKRLSKQTPPKSRRLSIENPNSLKSNVGNIKSKTPTLNRIRRLSLEGKKDSKEDSLHSTDIILSSNECITVMEVPKSPPTSSAYLKGPAFTDCAAKFPSFQGLKTPEQQKLARHEVQSGMHSGVNIFTESQTPNIARSTNGKGSQIRKSLRTIGKLINGSEKRNQQKMESSSIKGKDIGNDAKSPPTSKARVLRRQSLTGLPPPPGSDRRSSLGGTSTDDRTSDHRNALTPPSVRSSTKITKRWM